MPDLDVLPDPAFPPRRPPPSPSRRACPEQSRRGGRRAGAGAPKGNLNGLKSGRHSKQVAALRLALRTVPLTADVVRRVDAAGDGQRVLFARALHHIADLILLGSPEIQSRDPSKMQHFLIRELGKIGIPIKQSNDAEPPPDGRRGAPAPALERSEGCAPSKPPCEAK